MYPYLIFQILAFGRKKTRPKAQSPRQPSPVIASPPLPPHCVEPQRQGVRVWKPWTQGGGSIIQWLKHMDQTAWENNMERYGKHT